MNQTIKNETEVVEEVFIDEQTNDTKVEVEEKVKETYWSRKKIVLAVVFLLVVGMSLIGGYFLYHKFKKSSADTNVYNDDSKGLFDGFSKLMIDKANAQDNFIMEALDADSVGVEADSAYSLKSKTELETKILKESLVVEPAVELEVKEISKKEWEIKPLEKLEPNAFLKLSIDATYLDAEGEQKEREYSWAYQVKDNFKVIHSIPRESGSSVPLNTGIEVTFSHDNFVDYEKYFKITPTVAGNFEKHNRTMVFVPKEPLKSGTLYKVEIASGLPLSDSEKTLEQAYVFSFETEKENRANQDNWVSVYNRDFETGTKFPPVLQLSSYQKLAKLNLVLYQFSGFDQFFAKKKEKDKLPWWSYSREEYLVDTKELTKLDEFELNVKKNDNAQFVELPSALKQGFYLLEIKNGNSGNQIWITVSDLVSYYNMTKTDTLFWFNSLETKAPVSGVKVEFLDLGLETNSDKQGIAKIKTPQTILDSSKLEGENESYYIKASLNKDVLLLPASRVYRNYFWDEPSASDDYWSYLYSDRPRYQSTDQIKYWGMLKNRDEEVSKEKVTLTLFKEGYVDYYYRPVKIMEKELALNEQGIFVGEMDLKNLKPDYYTLELKVGDEIVKRKYVSVDPYTKPAFSLSLIPDKQVAYAGEVIKLKARAAFFEGTPLPDMKLKFKTPGSEKVYTTDENGEVELTFTKPYSECHDEWGCWPRYEYLYITPENSELAEIRADANIRIYGPKTYLETETKYPEKNIAEIKVITKLNDLNKLSQDNWWEKEKDDKPAPNTKIEVEIIKTTYTKRETGTYYDFVNKVSYKNYTYDRKEEKLRDFKAQTDAKGEYVFRQTTEEEASYQVKYKVIDSDNRYERSQSYFYYYDGISTNNYSSWNYNYYNLNLKGEGGYSLGEEVVAEFRNNDKILPDAKQRYLYLQLKNGLQEYSVSDKSVYNFNFKEDDIPNVNLVGVYFNGLSYVGTQSGYYGRGAYFEQKDRNLKIEVTSDKEKYEPGEKVSLVINVKDKDNNPVKAEVNLNLVDEAYYAVAEDTASPLETIYESLGSGSLLSKKTHENLASDQSMAEKGGCFLTGTKVLMADGSEKAIEKIKPGEKVKTLSDPMSTRMSEGVVREVWEHFVGEYLLVNNALEVTPEHQVYSNNRFTDAGLLKVGDWLLGYDGKKIEVKSIEIKFKKVPVYNLWVEPQNTFFAGGVYVHNQEKGGGPREFFTDAALFESITTDNRGGAKTTFTLPDNITSWRVTAQAISDNLYAGVSVTKIPVTLPVFADVTIGQEYLLDDKPIARMRAYGSALKKNDSVGFSFGLARDKNQTEVPGTAFSPIYYPLPSLELGSHDFLFSLKSKQGNDSIKLPIDIIASRIAIQKANVQKLEIGSTIQAPNDLPFAVVLSDTGQNHLYPYLQNLSWSGGDRIDQWFVSREARKELKKYYKEEIFLPDNSGKNYQVQNGGLSLLPYSSADPELTLRVLILGANEFDNEAIAQYFFEILENNRSSREEISVSLAGLAILQKPVLMRINIWLKRDDLGAKEKLYLALALAKLGDNENSLALYYKIVEEYGQKKDPYAIIKVTENNEEVFFHTAIAAVLASILDTDEADKYFNYLEENQVMYGKDKNSENLYNLEKLAYIKNTLTKLKPGISKVTYEIGGKQTKVELTGGQVHAFQTTKEEVNTFKVIEKEGDVGMSVRYTEKVDLNTVKRDQSISISRKYFVNGKETSEFKENDLIEVRLYPKFASGAIQGGYQISDVLPSGLMPISSLYNGYKSENCSFWYPYNFDGQKVKIMTNKDWKAGYCRDYFYYFAKVKNRGEYVAEPATIQSFVNPEYINYSEIKKVKISE